MIYSPVTSLPHLSTTTKTKWSGLGGTPSSLWPLVTPIIESLALTLRSIYACASSAVSYSASKGGSIFPLERVLLATLKAIYSPSGSLGIGSTETDLSRLFFFTSASRTLFTHADGRIPSLSAISLYDCNCLSVTLMCGRRAVAGFAVFGLPLGLSATANPIMTLLYHIKWGYIKFLINVFMVVQLIRCFKGATNTPEAIATTESNLLMEDSIMSNSNTSTPRKFLNRAQSAAVRIAAEKRSREFNAALPKELSVKTQYAPAQKMPASKAEAIQAILDQVKARRLAA